MAANYVRFLRGTPTAYGNLARKDPDTLYFISENGAKNGVLYLGEKLISGNVSIFSNLNSISDVVLQNVKDKDILAYDTETGNWVNKTASEIAQWIVKVMTGATAETDGTSGLVPVPQAGDQDKFLRGDGTWAEVTGKLDPTQAEDLSQLKATVSTLVGGYPNQSVYQIAVQALEDKLIAEDAKESLDSLQEIADWIQSHPKDAGELNTRITTLENTVFDVKEKNEFGVMVTKTKGLVTKVGDLTGDLNALKITVNGHTTSINELYDKLTWHDMADLDGSELN